MTKRKETDADAVIRFTLRSIIAQLSAAGVVATALTVGVVAFLNSRATVNQLSSQVFEMEAEYANARVREYSSSARHILDLSTALIGDAVLSTNNVEELTGHFIDVIQSNPRLSSSGFGWPNGDALWVNSEMNGDIGIHNYFLSEDGVTTRKMYRVKPDGERELQVQESSDYDARIRPWFKAALTSDEREAVWTKPYLFVPDYVPGVSLGQQVYDSTDNFLGVCIAEFDLRFLSKALVDLQNDRTGAQAIIFDDQGTVLAHTDPESTSRTESDGEINLVTLSQHSESLVRLLASDLDLPATVDKLRNGQINHVDRDGERFVVVVHKADLIHERTSLDWNVAVMVPEAVILAGVRQQGWVSLGIGMVIFVVFLVTSILVSQRVTNSFYGFYNEMQRLGDLDLDDPERSRTRISEVHALGRNLDQMRAGLRSFGRYVSAALVRELIGKGIEARPGGEDQEVTILFSDVEGFTTISENLNPHDLAVKISTNLEEVSRIVDQHQGTVDKYIGDSVMAFWNAPNPVPNHPLAACEAALEIMARIQSSETGEEPLWPIRIGVNTALAVVGNLGSLSRLDYTVIGDGVNLASRLEGINKEYGTRVLIGEATRKEVEAVMLTRPIDHAVVKGQSRPEPIHELMAPRDRATSEQLDLAEATSKALALYLEQDWVGALAAYQACLAIRSGDSAAALFVQRCEQHLASSTPEA